MPGSAACGVLKDAKIISRHRTLALVSFQVFINLSKLVTSWWPWPREAYPVGRPRGTHADPIRVSLIHDETSLWPTVNTAGNRKLRGERDARLIIRERLSARTEALKRAAKQKKQFEIADNPAGRVLKVSAGRIMKRTLPSGDKSVCGGV